MKYMRRYFLLAATVLSAATVTAGIFAVNESARRVSLGQTQRVVVYGDAKINGPAEVIDVEPSIKRIYEYVINAKEDLIEIVSLK